MKDLKLNELMKQPDMSQVKPPTTLAVTKMVKNLRAKATQKQKS